MAQQQQQRREPCGADARPLRADARRNRQRILEVAEQVFATEGLAVPVDVIACRAGVGVGTLYRHFPTKEDLFESIVLQRMERLADEAERLSRSDRPGPAFFEFVGLMGCEAAGKRDLIEGLTQAGVDFKARAHDVHERLRRQLVRLLEQAQEAGEVRPDVTGEEVLGLIMGTCLASGQTGAGDDAQRRMLAVVLDGLRPPRPPA